MQFDLMHLPDDIPIAVPIEDDGQIDSRTLLIMRNEAWRSLKESKRKQAAVRLASQRQSRRENIKETAFSVGQAAAEEAIMSMIPVARIGKLAKIVKGLSKGSSRKEV